MKHVTMSDMRTSADGPEIFIPGGWEAKVPEVSADADTLAAYTRYFQSDGLPPAKARLKAEGVVQATFESGFLRLLRMSLLRWAREYRKRFPHLRQKDGRLLGFQPERMQGAYVPNENTGRRGKGFIDQMFREMAENVDVN